VHLKRNRLASPVAGFIEFLRSGTWGMPGVTSPESAVLNADESV
jgi:hypothetical protein